MKRTKKLASLLLALVMVIGLAIPALAAGENGMITIDNAVEGQTYSVYQILDLESYNKDSGAYSYKATTNWANFITSDDIKGVYVDVDNQGYVTWHTTKNDKGEDVPADVVQFAKLAQEYAKNNKINAEATAVANSETVTFSGLDLGYYLMDSSLGVLCSLDTTNPSVTIQEKNDKPSIEKQVQEDSKTTAPGEGWQDTNDADIGQTVNFKTTVSAKKGAQNYVVHDKMSAGLTLDVDSIQVADATKGTDYTVTTEGLTDGCTFEITFIQTYLDKITADTDIVITYSATLNANAVIAGEGNPNETKLDYGDNNSTAWDKTITYTWEMDVLKYGNGDETNVLADAQFVLLNNDKTKVATVVNNKIAGWADVPDEGADWPANTVLTTNDQGKIDIEGLDADTYYLREVKAPAGYNKLNTDTTVTIIASQDSTTKELTQTPVTAKINNQSGSELPETGGIGTTIFYVVGSILLIGAAVLLITKKRMGAAK